MGWFSGLYRKIIVELTAGCHDGQEVRGPGRLPVMTASTGRASSAGL